MADDNLTLPLEGGKAQPPKRRCSQCKELKDIEDFFDRGDDRPGKRPECKSCSAAQLARHRLEHPQPYDPAKAKVYRKSSYQTRRATLRGWVTCNLQTRRQQCRAAGIEFTITADDIIALYEKQKHRCALSDVELRWGAGTNRGPDTLSVDRLNAAGPYVLENIRLVTHWANIARQRFTDAEFVERCRAVVNLADKPVIALMIATPKGRA